MSFDFCRKRIDKSRDDFPIIPFTWAHTKNATSFNKVLLHTQETFSLSHEHAPAYSAHR